MRKKIIAGNWKMNKTVTEAVELVKSLREMMPENCENEIVVCPPFTALYPVLEVLKGSKIAVGAQNMYFEEKGAYTGEISPEMLKELGCKYVILGHSERRQIFNENDAMIQKKIAAAFAKGLVPILCVGEPLEVREAREEVKYVEQQLQLDLEVFSNEQVASMVIAYEPIWAIGTGRTATPEQAEDMCRAIRNKIAAMFDSETADAVHIQYGGSVKGSNAKEILGQSDIDGALVGGASLKPDAFISIIEA